MKSGMGFIRRTKERSIHPPRCGLSTKLISNVIFPSPPSPCTVCYARVSPCYTRAPHATPGFTATPMVHLLHPDFCYIHNSPATSEPTMSTMHLLHLDLCYIHDSPATPGFSCYTRALPIYPLHLKPFSFCHDSILTHLCNDGVN